MKFDLHCHSTASDGKLTPSELIALALEKNIELFTVTDHDTVDGFKAIKASGQSLPAHFISGIEISALYLNNSVHIVGLDFDPDHEAIVAMINSQSEVRKVRAQTIDQRLAKLGIHGALEGALKYCDDFKHIGRPHFAEFLVAQGHVKNMNQAFDKYLGNGKPGDVKSGFPEMQQAIDAIHAAGGVSVLAHPLKYKMTFTKMKRMLTGFAEAGGCAVEVVGQQSDAATLKRLQKEVHNLGLAASGGSDFHDPNWRWAQLGEVSDLPSELPAVWQCFKRTLIQ